ncbi:MAG: TlpA disulfide reductase family protein [Terracidiphilus sp.]
MKISLRILAMLAACILISPAQSEQAPNLKFKDLAGKTHKVAELRGSIVVLNFWATWCVPCREELPLLSRLSREYAGRKIRFIAISADDGKDRAKVDQFLSRSPLDMEVWVGGDLDALDLLTRTKMGNELPATMILDEQGEIVTRIEGEAREADLKAPLDWLLGGRSGVPPAAEINRY